MVWRIGIRPHGVGRTAEVATIDLWCAYHAAALAVVGGALGCCAGAIVSMMISWPGMQGQDCVLSCPKSCVPEGVPSVWNAECSWENPLSIKAKSPQPTAHTQHPKPHNIFLTSTKPAKSASIAKRYSARAVGVDLHKGRKGDVRCKLHESPLS